MKRRSINPTNGVFLFLVSSLLYVMLPVLVLERMVLDANLLTTTIFPVYRFLSLAVCSLVILEILSVGKLRINALSILMVGLIVIGLVKGIFQVVNMGHFFTHISADFSVLAFYVAGTSSNLKAEKLVSLFKVIAYVFLAEFTLLIAISYQAYLYSGLLAADNFHLSLNVAPLLVSFVYFMVKGPSVLNIVVLVLLFSSGKRSLFVTALLIYVLYFFLVGAKRGAVVHTIRRTLPFVLIIAVLVSALSVFAPTLTFAAVNRLTGLVYFGAEGFDMDKISSGRWNEFITVYDSISDSISDYLCGTGFGRSFNIRYESDIDHKIYDWEKLGFDVLPVHLMYHFGMLGAIVISGMLIVLLVKNWRSIHSGFEKRCNKFYESQLIIYISTCALVINSLFTYINPDPFLWFCLGLISSKQMRNCCVTQDGLSDLVTRHAK